MSHLSRVGVVAVMLLGLLGARSAWAADGSIGPVILGLRWSTVPSTACDERDVQLVLSTCACGVELLAAEREDSGAIDVQVRVQPGLDCIACEPDTQRVDLGRLAPGIRPLEVRIEIEYETPPGPEWPASPLTGIVPLPVKLGCVLGVAHLQRVFVEQGPPCGDCPTPVCPGDSIDVRLEGMFATSCTRVLEVSLEPNPASSPSLLVVRVTYSDRENCAVCGLAAVPWSARVRLPGLPEGEGVPVPLAVEAWTRNFCLADSALRFEGRAEFPIVVVDTCATTTNEPVVLSVPRPTPFSTTTSLTLTLATSGAVDVGVFDVTGRRVARLLRESHTAAGVHVLSWDGRLEGGGRARDGVYFVRVRARGGETSARRIVFLSGGAP